MTVHIYRLNKCAVFEFQSLSIITPGFLPLCRCLKRPTNIHDQLLTRIGNPIGILRKGSEGKVEHRQENNGCSEYICWRQTTVTFRRLAARSGDARKDTKALTNPQHIRT